MIEEAYCSFEVARLLKEKGFNEIVRAYHNIYDKVHLDFNVSVDAPHLQIPCPTHQMAMAWLREVHNLFIELRTEETNGKTRYDFDIIPINGRKIVWKHYDSLPFVECNSYEEAVEAALKYCLENSI